MTATSYGTKYTCYHCGCKFYDLNRPEPICPKCQTDQRTAPKIDPKTVVAKKGQPKANDYYAFGEIEEEFEPEVEEIEEEEAGDEDFDEE